MSLLQKSKKKYSYSMKKFYKLVVLLLPLLLFVSCGKRIYEISMEDSLFEEFKEKGFFEGKITFKKYPEGKAFELIEMKKFRIELVSSELEKLEKPVYKKAIKGGTIKKVTIKNPDKTWFSFNVPLERRTLYPGILFTEDCPVSINIEEINEDSLYTIENIPQNYIALPVKINADTADEKILYSDDELYPLYEADFAFADTGLLENKKEKDGIDLLALNLISNWKILLNHYNKTKDDEVYFFKSPEKEEITFVSAVGDMMLGRGVQDSMFATKKAETVFTDTMPILKESDYTIGNLECVVTERNLKTPKTYNFKVSKESLKYLSEAGFDYLMMTNNHSYDYGEEGFKDTLKAVAEAGFATSGAGYTKEEAMKFYRTILNGQHYSILSVGAYPVENSGFNGEKQATATDTRAGVIWKSPEVIELVKEEKKTGAVIIINVHAGSEYVKKPNAVQQSFYKELCDAGADVIFGSHPHILQPVEMYNGSLIVWSLGNYIFPGMDGMAGATDTMIIRTGFNKNKLIYYRKFPAWIDNTKVRLKK